MPIDIRGTDNKFWDIVWNRPYTNYEGHHQVFWNEIKKLARGRILDLGCGSGSTWKGFTGDITGIDFSVAGVREARKNIPSGKFYVGDVQNVPLKGQYDTVVVSGVVNYYQDLTKIKAEIKRLTKPGGIAVVTINVIDDFPDRHWDIRRVGDEFSPLGLTSPIFFEGIGWFIKIDI